MFAMINFTVNPAPLTSRVAALTRRVLSMVKALILVSCTLGLTACPADLVATGTAIKVLDLIDEDGTLYSGTVAKGSTTIQVLLPDGYNLSAKSTLRDDYETPEAFEADCYSTNGGSKILIKFKMTPKLTLSNGAQIGEGSQIDNSGKPQVFAANTYLTLSVKNGSKTTPYKVYVGTQAQLDATELVSDPSSTYIASFDLYNANNGKLSVSTLISNANDENQDTNLITIFLPADTPRITEGSSQIRLEAPSAMLVTPVSGTLPDKFEPNEPVAGEDSVLNVTYTVYPIGQTPDFLLARTYKVVLKRTGVAQGTPSDPEPGTSIKVLDLIDEDGTLYPGVVAKGSTTILVTLPDDYALPAESTLTDEFKDADGKFDEAKYREECFKNGTPIKFKMTPKLTLSGVTISADSQIQDNGEKQVFPAGKYLTLSVLNGSKTTTYKVFVGTKAQLEAAELVSDPSTTQIASFDLYNANGKLSLNTLITHENDQNDDKNLITIFLPADTPQITAGRSQISLVSSSTMVVTPASGTLPVDFEPNEWVAGTDSELDVTYTVYPIGQTPDFLFARTYKVVLNRSGAAQGTPLDPNSTHIASFDLYGANNEKISRYTVITHANSENTDTNRITIVLPYGTERITAGFSQISLVSPNMVVTPVSGTLPANFEPNEPPTDGADSVLDVTYTVYPKGQTPASAFARTYTVVLKRSNAEQGTLPDPGASLDKLTLTLTGTLNGAIPAGEKAGAFAASGTAVSLGTPVYTLEEGDFGTTDGDVPKNNDNGKFTIAGTDLLVGTDELSIGFYYIVVKATIEDTNGTPLTDIIPITQAFKIQVLDKRPTWGE
jgi:hypothetical protein